MEVLPETVDTDRLPRAEEDPSVAAASAGCEKVWQGSIGRLRIYDQPGSTGRRVFAYLSPGNNADYVGNSQDPNVINALFLARDNGRSVQGFKNVQCRIECVEY